MDEQDRNDTTPDEEVEAHSKRFDASQDAPADAEDGDDVEAHQLRRPPANY